MTLRKYLGNRRITAVEQHDFDRIIKLTIGEKEYECSIVIEFFSHGNIILLNPKGEIIFPLLSQRWSHRVIETGEIYVPPPEQVNPFKLSKKDFEDLILKSKSDLVRTLAVNVNLSGVYAEEICERAHIDKNTKVKELREEELDRVFVTLTSFLETFNKREFHPVVVKKDSEEVDVLPFKFTSYRNVVFEPVDSFSRSLERFITVKKPRGKISKTKQTMDKLGRQIKQQKEALPMLQQGIQQKKLEGDLLYLHYKECEGLLQDINEVLQYKNKEEKIREINQREMVKKFDPTQDELIVNLFDTNGDVHEVKLDFRRSIAENAEQAYNESKKFRSKLAGAQKAIKETMKRIESVKKEEAREKKVEKKIPVRTELWFERFRWFISSDGNIVVGGRDAKSNDQVIKKYLKPGDRYVHADIQGAPSCVVKSKGIHDRKILISKETLREACIFSASYSKAWRQFAEAQAYWVLPEQVSKTPQTGEFLPKGAFVIRGKRNYYRCKLEVAIGRVTIDETEKIMGGPVNAVKKRSDRYIVLVPGSLHRGDVAKKLAEVFNVHREEVERVIPPGDVSVVETVGFQITI
jgi:predicted ribosome quality control (RQC) complex YloA/Tae2 family protein